MYKKEIIKLLVVFITLILFLTYPLKTFACIAFSPDPWYKLKIEFDKKTLPTGVEVTPSDSSYLPVSLKNHSSVPLYISNNKNPKSYGHSYSEYSELPYGTIPIYKLVNGESYYFEPDPQNFPEPAKWRKNTINRYDSSASELVIDEGILDITGTGIKNTYKDDRPYNITLPSPSKFIMSVYYGKNPLQITGIVLYELNQNYNPKKESDSIKACDDFYKQAKPIEFIILAILPILIVIVVTVLLYFVYRVIKAHSKRK